MKKLTLVVLAAGMGSRYGGLKQMDAMGPQGEWLLDYSVHDAILAGFERIVFIVRDSFITEFQEVVGARFADKVEVDYVVQELNQLPQGFEVPEGREKPWGTAHAILQARDAVEGAFAVINADDYYGKDSYVQMAKWLKEEEDENEYCMIGYKLENTLSDYGTVNRGICTTKNLLLESVHECEKIAKTETGAVYPHEDGSLISLSGKEIASMNLWGFQNSVFDKLENKMVQFLKESGHEMKSEIYIPTVINELMHSGEIRVSVLETSSEWFGVTYQEDKEMVQRKISSMIEAGIYSNELWSEMEEIA